VSAGHGSCTGSGASSPNLQAQLFARCGTTPREPDGSTPNLPLAGCSTPSLVKNMHNSMKEALGIARRLPTRRGAAALVKLCAAEVERSSGRDRSRRMIGRQGQARRGVRKAITAVVNSAFCCFFFGPAKGEGGVGRSGERGPETKRSVDQLRVQRYAAARKLRRRQASGEHQVAGRVQPGRCLRHPSDHRRCGGDAVTKRRARRGGSPTTSSPRTSSTQKSTSVLSRWRE